MNMDLTFRLRGHNRVLSHLLFWLCYWLYHSLLYGSYDQNYVVQFALESWYLPVKIAATYCTLYVLLPRYFLQREYVKFVLILAGLLVCAAVLQRFLDVSVLSEAFYPAFAEKPFFSAAPVLKIILGIYPVVILAAFIKLAKYWYERDMDAQKLEKEKLGAELKFLKAQIHPHFLFNTLNNLYALTLKGSRKASDVVLKLSGLLSFMLYEGSKPKVPLKDELEVVETFISLENIRYGERLDVTYKVEGITEDKEIPPMLILPFIENTFKHGTSEQREKAWINIQISIIQNRFEMLVENSKPNTVPNAEPEPDYKQGIGLKNVKRRLELLFGEKHDLQLFDNGDIFRVILKLELDSPLKPE